MNLKSNLSVDHLSAFESVGMDFPREGLTNQRIALFGLMTYCMENQKTASIPSHCIDHIPKPFLDSNRFLEYLEFGMNLIYYYSRAKFFRPRIPLTKVFSVNHDNCAFSRSSPFQLLPFKDALYFGFSRLQLIAENEDYKRIFRSISFAPDIISTATKFIKALKTSVDGPFNCVSLRLEKDWLQYINSRKFVGDPSEVKFFTKSNILNQMYELSQITDIPSFYCCADLNDLPFSFDQFKSEAAIRGILVFNKRDFKFPSQLSLSSLTSAAIDYLISLKSVAYLGSTRSTFSNLISLDSYLLKHNNHYDYLMNSQINHPVLRSNIIF